MTNKTIQLAKQQKHLNPPMHVSYVIHISMVNYYQSTTRKNNTRSKAFKPSTATTCSQAPINISITEINNKI
jgi:hypothetical protein